MEAYYVPVTGMVRNAKFIVPPDMMMLATSLAIHSRVKGSATQTDMGRIVVQVVFLRTPTGLAITTAIKSMVANSVIATGTELVALSSVPRTMTPMDITRAVKLMVGKFVWTTGLEVNAKRTAKQ